METKRVTIDEMIMNWFDRTKEFLRLMPFDPLKIKEKTKIKILGTDKEGEVEFEEHPIFRIFHQVNRYNRTEAPEIIKSCPHILSQILEIYPVDEFVERFVLEKHKKRARSLLAGFSKIVSIALKEIPPWKIRLTNILLGLTEPLDSQQLTNLLESKLIQLQNEAEEDPEKKKAIELIEQLRQVQSEKEKDQSNQTLVKKKPSTSN